MVINSIGAGNGRWDDPNSRIDRIDSAVRQLVHLVRKQVCGPRPANGVLLDIRVDDVRCRIEAVDYVHAVSVCSPHSPADPETGNAAAGAPPVGGMLSPREAEVAMMVAQGFPNKAIAAVLDISSFTVSSYLRRIFAKLGVNSRAAMVAQVLEQRLLPQSVNGSDAADTRSGRDCLR